MVHVVPFVFFLILSYLLQGRPFYKKHKFSLSRLISQRVRWFWQRTHDWAMGSWWLVDGLHNFLNWLTSRTWNHVHTICHLGDIYRHSTKESELGLNSYLSAAGFLVRFQQRVELGQSSVLHIFWIRSGAAVVRGCIMS